MQKNIILMVQVSTDSASWDKSLLHYPCCDRYFLSRLKKYFRKKERLPPFIFICIFQVRTGLTCYWSFVPLCNALCDLTWFPVASNKLAFVLLSYKVFSYISIWQFGNILYAIIMNQTKGLRKTKYINAYKIYNWSIYGK